MPTRLSELKPGQTAVIQRLGAHPLSAKLTEMGCLPGEWLRVIRIAPPGDPMSIEILGYQLALRRQEAEVVEVEVRPNIPAFPPADGPAAVTDANEENPAGAFPQPCR